MVGTLTTPVPGTSLRFLNYRRLSPANSTGSTPKMFRVCRPSVHAVLEGKPPTTRRQESLYEVLLVRRDATLTEIKTAYRSLAKLYHPDAKQRGDRDFIEIHNAYATLSDPKARATYELKLRSRAGLHTAVVKRPGFYTGRRWETDQCW